MELEHLGVGNWLLESEKKLLEIVSNQLSIDSIDRIKEQKNRTEQKNTQTVYAGVKSRN